MPHRLSFKPSKRQLGKWARLTKLASSSGRNGWSTDQQDTPENLLTQQLETAGGKLWVRPASSPREQPA